MLLYFVPFLFINFCYEIAIMSFKKTLLGAGLALSALTPFAALSAPGDTFEIKGGFDYWSANAKKNDIKAGERQSQYSYYVGFEHFVPLIPNAKIRSTNVKSSKLDTSYRQVDYIAYYRLIDTNMLGVDFGLNMQHFSGVKDHDWQPAAYGDVEFTIPATPVTLYSTVSAGRFDGTKTFDGEAGAKWTIEMGPLDLGLKAGYRVMDNEFKHKATKETNIRMDGYFMGAELKF